MPPSRCSSAASKVWRCRAEAVSIPKGAPSTMIGATAHPCSPALCTAVAVALDIAVAPMWPEPTPPSARISASRGWLASG